MLPHGEYLNRVTHLFLIKRLCLHEALCDLPLIGLGPFLASCAAHLFLPPTTNIDNDFNFPGTERAGSRSLSVGCGHPSSKPCERFLRHSTRSSSFRCCQCHPGYDQSMFLPTPSWPISEPQLPRIRWPTNRITWILGLHAAADSKLSTGG